MLGAGFGDEGKGKTVSYLVSKSDKPVVIRFSGGHQAGHTVNYQGHNHVFSHFGSGTLQGIPTYWSEYCTVYPTGLVNEWKALLPYNPILFIHRHSPVTTPYDIVANRYFEEENEHGSCGLGFGTTIERHELLKLFYKDLFIKKIFEEKLKNIKEYYCKKNGRFKELFTTHTFINKLDHYKKAVDVITSHNIGNYVGEGIDTFSFLKTDHLIFEGSQGLLLDKDLGFFPNVTRSKTDHTNALNIIDSFNCFEYSNIDIYYVSRCYQTRHGNGFMSDERIVELINNENETNKVNLQQGSFRKGYLDLDLLYYGLDDVKENLFNINRHLVLTCIDQFKGEEVPVIRKREIEVIKKRDINTFLNLPSVLYSYGPETDKMTDNLYGI